MGEGSAGGHGEGTARGCPAAARVSRRLLPRRGGRGYCREVWEWWPQGGLRDKKWVAKDPGRCPRGARGGFPRMEFLPNRPGKLPRRSLGMLSGILGAEIWRKASGRCLEGILDGSLRVELPPKEKNLRKLSWRRLGLLPGTWERPWRSLSWIPELPQERKTIPGSFLWMGTAQGTTPASESPKQRLFLHV